MVHSFRTILAMVTVVTRSRPLHRSRASARVRVTWPKNRLLGQVSQNSWAGIWSAI